MEAMEEKGMTKVVVKDKEGLVVELERGGDFQLAPYATPYPHHAPPQVEIAPQSGTVQKPSEEAEALPSGKAITSPMVGSFYSSPSPDDDPFVKVGDTVKEDTVLCIIEAMKVMNEVKAGVKGVIKEILVSNGDAVEFGTSLFRIEAAQ